MGWEIKELEKFISKWLESDWFISEPHPLWNCYLLLTASHFLPFDILLILSFCRTTKPSKTFYLKLERNLRTVRIKLKRLIYDTTFVLKLQGKFEINLYFLYSLAPFPDTCWLKLYLFLFNFNNGVRGI